MTTKFKTPIQIKVDKVLVTLINNSEVELKTEDTSMICGISVLRTILSTLEDLKESYQDDYGSRCFSDDDEENFCN